MQAPNTAEAPAAPGQDLRSLVQEVMAAAEDKLGQRTEAFFVGDIMGISDWLVITSGSNARQVRAIVEHIEETLTTSADGHKPIRIEGGDTYEWVLMDYGPFIVHIFDEDTRGYYDLERLWSDVPRMDLAVDTDQDNEG